MILREMEIGDLGILYMLNSAEYTKYSTEETLNVFFIKIGLLSSIHVSYDLYRECKIQIELRLD